MTTVETVLVVALYARISLDANGNMLGIERQLQDLRRMAAERGWKIVEYIDNNRSAAKDTAKRPAFDQMLEDIRAGRIHAIAVWHLDRLCRHPKQLERVLDTEAPVFTVTAGELDLSTPAGRAVARQSSY